MLPFINFPNYLHKFSPQKTFHIVLVFPNFSTFVEKFLFPWTVYQGKEKKGDKKYKRTKFTINKLSTQKKLLYIKYNLFLNC